jgi:hypothetical protein
VDRDQRHYRGGLGNVPGAFHYQPAVRSGDCFTGATANGPLSSCVHAFTKAFTQLVSDPANETIN